MTPLLTYFDVRCRAEIVRLILEETATSYRERRVDVAEWPMLKPTLLFGQLPTYEDGDLLIVQSHAICRYLARKHDLQGADEREHTFRGADGNRKDRISIPSHDPTSKGSVSTACLVPRPQ
jgi:glutathione S-transferase